MNRPFNYEKMMIARNLFLPIRAYSAKRFRKNQKPPKHFKDTPGANPGIDNRLQFYKENELSAKIKDDDGFNDLYEDTSYLESDFLNVGKSYTMHMRELGIKKSKLKNQITYDKYVKEVEPSFLTFAEKNQIKTLHESNREEWNIEKLSQSFPALPYTIKKVLHSKWDPKSVERIVQYDEKVISNWEAFRAGELALNPEMEKHLQNFQDRQIISTNREELAKNFVPPKMELSKPESKMFSRIAETYLLPSLKKKDDPGDENTVIEVNKNEDERITARKAMTNFNSDNDSDSEPEENRVHTNFKNVQSLIDQDRNQTLQIIPSKQENEMSLLSRNLKNDDHRQKNKPMTFQEFLERNVASTENSMSPEDIVLKETYKRHMEKVAVFDSKPAVVRSTSPESENEVSADDSDYKVSRRRNMEDVTLFNTKSAAIRSKDLVREKAVSVGDSDYKISKYKNNYMSMEETDEIIRSEEHVNRQLTLNFNASSLDTYVKEWHKKEDEVDNEPSFINIPKHRYKEGMTYRVKNCYYDDDGEFLYKVPGLQN